MCLTQPPNKMPTEYSMALWNKRLRCLTVYEDYVLKGIIVEALPETIINTIMSSWGLKKIATVCDVARQETSLTRLRRGSHRADTTHNKVKQGNRRRNSGHKGIDVYNVEASGSSSISTSLRTGSQAPIFLLALPTWLQNRTSIPELYFRHLDAPSCRFCLVANLLTTQCPAIPLQIRAKLINTSEMSLQTLTSSRD